MSDTRGPIRVMIVDDHAVVRSGLTAFLSVYDDLELVAEAAGGHEAVARSVEANPDVILMDLVMPEMDGAATIRAIRQQCPRARVVALTSFRDESLVQAALQAGAIGYLLKNVAADDLAAAIRAAYLGRATLAVEATEALIHAVTQPKATDYELTERELDVLELMVQGLNNQQIADALIVSRSTAKFHVSSILSKLGAQSRTEAVARAVAEGLLAHRPVQETDGQASALRSDSAFSSPA